MKPESQQILDDALGRLRKLQAETVPVRPALALGHACDALEKARTARGSTALAGLSPDLFKHTNEFRRKDDQ